jgi:hypothetical protein
LPGAARQDLAKEGGSPGHPRFGGRSTPACATPSARVGGSFAPRASNTTGRVARGRRVSARPTPRDEAPRRWRDVAAAGAGDGTSSGGPATHLVAGDATMPCGGRCPRSTVGLGTPYAA